MAVTRRRLVSAPDTPAQLSIVLMPPCTCSSPDPEPAVSRPMPTPSTPVTECLVPSTAGSLGGRRSGRLLVDRTASQPDCPFVVQPGERGQSEPGGVQVLPGPTPSEVPASRRSVLRRSNSYRADTPGWSGQTPVGELLRSSANRILGVPFGSAVEHGDELAEASRRGHTWEGNVAYD
jgi:hypothetical protein